MVSDQIVLVGTTESIAMGTVASEVAGIVEDFPVNEGDYVEKNALLVRLRANGLGHLLQGAGSEFYRGICSVVVGGLLFSTVFTIFLIPSLLSLSLDAADFLKRRFARRLSS